MSLEKNKMLVRQLYDQVINRGDFGQADNLIAPDYIQHSVLDIPSGRESFKSFFTRFRKTFPDARVVIKDMVAEQDKVIVPYKLTMTVRRLFGHRMIAVSGIDIFRIERDYIVEHWDVIDFLSALRQAGIFGSILLWWRWYRKRKG